MNKSYLSRLLAAALAVTATVYADTNSTNKTFLMPRSHGVNLAMDYASWSDTLHTKGNDLFGGNVQLSWFYRASTNEKELGKYFGIRNKNIVHLRHEAASENPSTVNNDLEFGYLIHKKAATAVANSEATVCLKPEQTSYGFVLDYHQNLEKLLDGLYFKIAIPIVYVKNSMHVTVSKCSDGDETQVKNLADYLKGNFEDTASANNKQSKLTAAILGCSDSETGVADIPLKLGYDFVREEDYHAGINIGLTIPTGNEAKGVKLFEAIVGNGGHFGFGAGLDGSVKLWGEDNHTLRLVAAVDYRYLFESCEKRTLGLAGDCDDKCNTTNCTSPTAVAGSSCATACPTPCETSCRTADVSEATRDCGGSCPTDCPTEKTSCSTSRCARNWSWYYLVAKDGDKSLTPAANILTQSVDVTPGSQVDALIKLDYRCCGFLVDLGYNLFYKEEESVKLKNAIPAGYYLAARNYDTSAGFVKPVATTGSIDKKDAERAVATSSDTADTIGKEISASTVSTGPARSPSQLTHKVIGALGYRFEDLDTPVTVGVGGGYEFADRKALECWEVWLKAGVNF